MVSGHYANIEENMALAEILPADHFRTISQKVRNTVALTSNEVGVTITMKQPFAKTLRFPVPWDGILYGVARKTELLRQIGTDKEGYFWVTSITCNDWDDCFLLVLESADVLRYRAFYISADEVRELLEHCLRIPEQCVQES